MSTENLLINIEHLHKSFGTAEVLKDVSISVHTGEFVSIIGKSGSGKSTLISIMGLLEEKSQGHFNLCNHDTDKLSNYQRAQIRGKNLGWVFQNFNLLSDMTVLENVTLPARFNVSEGDTNQRAIELLSKVGLADKITSYPTELSGGQQQRVAIARALIMNPDVLFCDEPTGNLDSANAKVVSSLLHELNQDGMTIVLVTHDRELADTASRVIEISDGRIFNHV